MDVGSSPEPTGDDLAGTVSWAELTEETIGRLTAAGVEHATSEARWIVEEASGLDSSELRIRGGGVLATERCVAHLDAMVARRLTGEPLQYVVGHWPFRDLDLMVDRRVLIPRPETEQVAGWALEQLDRLVADGLTRPAPVAQLPDGKATVVDLGSGSGALALAIASERPGVDVWAVERDPDAATVLRANLTGLGRAGRRVGIAEGSWFDALPGELAARVDLVVSNPPYVATTETLPSGVLDWEPADALFCGPEGTEAIDVILAAAPRWLAPHGVIVIEIGATQGSRAAAAATSAGFGSVRVARDLAGRDRAVIARMGS